MLFLAILHLIEVWIICMQTFLRYIIREIVIYVPYIGQYD